MMILEEIENEELGRGKRRFLTKRLPWRSTQLEELMRSLDRQEATISLKLGPAKIQWTVYG